MEVSFTYILNTSKRKREGGREGLDQYITISWPLIFVKAKSNVTQPKSRLRRKKHKDGRVR